MWVILYKNLGSGCWSFLGPVSTRDEAAFCLKSLPEVCEGKLYNMDRLVEKLGLRWSEKEKYSPSYNPDEE